jgi:hypothetical protein
LWSIHFKEEQGGEPGGKNGWASGRNSLRPPGVSIHLTGRNDEFSQNISDTGPSTEGRSIGCGRDKSAPTVYGLFCENSSLRPFAHFPFSFSFFEIY